MIFFKRGSVECVLVIIGDRYFPFTIVVCSFPCFVFYVTTYFLFFFFCLRDYVNDSFSLLKKVYHFFIFVKFFYWTYFIYSYFFVAHLNNFSYFSCKVFTSNLSYSFSNVIFCCGVRVYSWIFLSVATILVLTLFPVDIYSPIHGICL